MCHANDARQQETVRLIEELLNGQMAALGDLMTLYAPFAKSVLKRIRCEAECRTHDDQDIEDTWDKIYPRLPTYEPKTACFSTWFATILKRTAIDNHRKRKAAKRGGGKKIGSIDTHADYQLRDDKQGPVEVAENKERDDAVRKAIADLSTEDQTLIRLRYVDELTLKQIAQKMGWFIDGCADTSRVDRRLAQIREKLKPVLSDYQDDDRHG